MLFGMQRFTGRNLISSAGLVLSSLTLLGCGPTGPTPAANSQRPVVERVAIDRGPVSRAESRLNPYHRHEEPGPELSKVVIQDKREWDLPETAARSLSRIGSAAVPELTKQLNDNDPAVRQRAADVLARIGPAAKQAVPDLVAALEDGDEAVRKSAALALGQIGPAASEAVPALTRMMKESVAKFPPEKPQR